MCCSNKLDGVLKNANFNNQKLIKKNINDCKKNVKKKSNISKTSLTKFCKLLLKIRKLFKKNNSCRA